MYRNTFVLLCFVQSFVLAIENPSVVYEEIPVHLSHMVQTASKTERGGVGYASGFLVGCRKAVMTSAHALHREPKNNIIYLADGSGTFVKRIFLPKNSQDLNNDIAIVELLLPASKKHVYVGDLVVDDSELRPPAGKRVQATYLLGFGKGGKNRKLSEGVNVFGMKLGRDSGKTREGMYMLSPFRYMNSNSTHGDSGGPAAIMQNSRAIGGSSWLRAFGVITTGSKGKFTLITSIPKHIDFIRDAVNKICGRKVVCAPTKQALSRLEEDQVLVSTANGTSCALQAEDVLFGDTTGEF